MVGQDGMKYCCCKLSRELKCLREIYKVESDNLNKMNAGIENKGGWTGHTAKWDM